MDNNIVKKLTTLKNKIEDDKAQKQVAETTIKKLKKELKDEYNLNSIEDAEKKLDEIEKEITEKEEKAENLVNTLEEMVNE